MSMIPAIQIRTTDIRMGMETVPHRFTYEQPRGIQDIEQPRAEQSIQQPRGELLIDQSKAFDAVGYMKPTVLTDRIAAEARRIFLEGLGRKVEQGNRLAAIHQGGDPIADIGWEAVTLETPMSLLGEARYDNVDIQYHARQPEIEVNVRRAETNYTPQKPQFQFTRGSLNTYVQQYPKVEIIPPQIDLVL